VSDRALDPGQALEQLLALLERVQQTLVQLRLRLGLVALAALLGGAPEQPQRQRERVGHSAREVDLVGREVATAFAGEHEARR
jgi:phage terminase Nu1 subunit (DNA packaging protein)